MVIKKYVPITRRVTALKIFDTRRRGKTKSSEDACWAEPLALITIGIQDVQCTCIYHTA